MRGRQQRAQRRSAAPTAGVAAQPVPAASELIALQQSAGNAAVARLIARQTTTAPPTQAGSQPGNAAPALPFSPSFRDLWRDFQHLAIFDRERARASAPDLVNRLNDRDDVLAHGMPLANWLLQEGLNDLARQVLSSLETSWTVSWATGGDVAATGHLGMITVTPQSLIDRGEAAARSGDHGLAHDILTRAYMALVLGIETETRRRGAFLERSGQHVLSSGVGTFSRIMTYSSIGDMYDQMRRILGFHRRLQRELDSAGDPNGARAAGAAGRRLRDAITERYSPPVDLMTAEVTQVDTPRGPGLRMHGRNAAETDLTQLPGLPSPTEIGSNYQRQTSTAITEALAGQADLLEDLLAEPEVQRAFPDRRIDMNETGHRLRVWNAMFRAFQRQAGADALRLLMDLIGRYLRAFTIHTEYNVRDWGTSYLSSEMPTDLAGRAERDCGVYAVMVAYEVYRAARDASPRLNLRFELVAAPEHVMLVIRDGQRTFLVNNDRVTGPHSDTRAIAEAQAGVRRTQFLLTPAVVTEAGGTGMAERAFRDNLWQRYLDTTSWGLAPEPPTGPNDTRSDAERSEAAHARMYREQEEFANGAAAVRAALRRLDAELAAPGAARAQLIDRSLGDQRPRYLRLAMLLLRYTQYMNRSSLADPQRQQVNVSASRPQARARLNFGYLVGSSGTEPHPLVRVDQLLGELQQLGRTLAPEDVAFRQAVAQVPILRGATP